MTHQEKLIAILTNLLGVLGSLSINIYLPALPFLMHFFHASPQVLKLSISLFLIGFGASQFIWGSLSERFGRKKSVLMGLAIACIGTTITMLAPNAVIFNLGRLIEGSGIGCASVLARVMLTDSFNRKTLPIVMSYLITLANIMPAVAPITGGYLLKWLGWRYIFLLLLIYTIILLMGFYKKIPETHKQIRYDLSFMAALKDYWIVLKHREFFGYLLPYYLMSGGMMGYYAAAPFIFITHLHLNPQHYGFMQIITVVGYIIGTNATRLLAQWLSMRTIIVLGNFIGLFSGLILLIFWMLFHINIFTVLLPITIFCLAAGIISPIANASAMSLMSHKAGSSGATSGAIIYAVSALFSTIISNQNLSTLAPLTIYIVAITLCSTIGFGILIIYFGRKDATTHT